LTENLLLRDIGVIIVAAMLFAALARRARVPSIVAYIVAGLTIGPVLGLVRVSEMLELIAEVGIALLLFFVGLELSFDKVRDLGRVVGVAALVQMALTVTLAYGLASLLGFGGSDSLFVALAAAFSSTVVAVKVLAEVGGFKELYGRIAVGVLLVQDLAVVVVLTFLAGLGRQSGVQPTEVAGGLLAAFVGMGVLLATAVLASKRVLPVAFGWVSRSQEALFIWSLCWCFVFILAAQGMQLSVEIGAFLAGISLAQLTLSHELRRRVHPLMNFFIAVFFVTLGIQMELGQALERWPATLALSLFVLLAKPLMITALVGRQGYGERTAFLSGVTLGQISEFSFVLGALSLSAGLIEDATFSVIGAVGLITMGASSYMILYGERLHDWVSRSGLARRLGASDEDRSAREPQLEGHVIVVGMNALGRRIVHELVARGERTLAIDTDPGKLRGLPGNTMIGNTDYLSVLHEAGLERAKLLVSALQIEDTNRMLAYRARECGVPSSLHAFDQSLVPELRQLGATHLMDSRSVGIERVMDALHDAGVYGP
jgi:Kef-type K+ transport system membrane component KefB